MDSWLASFSDYTHALFESNTLIYGAAFVGVLEGLLIARVFRASVWRSLLAMIAANYISMFAGVSFRHLVIPELEFITLDHALSSLLGVGAAFLLLATIVEWPFLLWPLRQHRARVWQAFKASLLAQFASCVILAGLHGVTSDFSLLTRTKRADDLAFVHRADAVVYYIGDDDYLWRKHLDQSPPERLQVLPRHPAAAFLYAWPTPDQPTVDLWLSSSRKDPKPTLLLPAFARNATLLPKPRPGKETPDRPPVDPKQPSRLREQRGDLDWQLAIVTESGEPLRARHVSTNEQFDLGMVTPFFTWEARRAALLPDNQVILEFGPQLLLLDLNSRQVAVVARGRSPVVVLDSGAAPRTP